MNRKHCLDWIWKGNDCGAAQTHPVWEITAFILSVISGNYTFSRTVRELWGKTIAARKNGQRHGNRLCRRFPQSEPTSVKHLKQDLALTRTLRFIRIYHAVWLVDLWAFTTGIMFWIVFDALMFFCVSAFLLFLPPLLLSQAGPSSEQDTSISTIQGGAAPCAVAQSLFFLLPLLFLSLKVGMWNCAKVIHLIFFGARTLEIALSIQFLLTGSYC